jgi:Zn-dependent peptidase ImmA (M78 family)
MNLNPHEAAERIRKTAWGDKPFPVDPVVIAKSLSLQVFETDLPDDVSGALLKEKGSDPLIVVHYADSDNRKRFTCAHELGHYISRAESKVIEDNYNYIDYRNSNASTGKDEDEIFANQFAANLLMPSDEVKRLHRKKASHIEMAQYFGVSSGAMKYRLHNLELL